MSEEEEVDKISDVANKIYDAIFDGLDSVEIDGESIPITKTSRSKVRLVERDGFTFIEQNPHKDSRWAKLAQEGAQIMWVMRGRKYLAQIKDGKFLNLRRK
ncbi:MAG: hypothetical protein ACFFCP_09500 [Promethearchaeota archaeon]